MLLVSCLQKKIYNQLIFKVFFKILLWTFFYNKYISKFVTLYLYQIYRYTSSTVHISIYRYTSITVPISIYRYTSNSVLISIYRYVGSTVPILIYRYVGSTVPTCTGQLGHGIREVCRGGISSLVSDVRHSIAAPSASRCDEFSSGIWLWPASLHDTQHYDTGKQSIIFINI